MRYSTCRLFFECPKDRHLLHTSNKKQQKMNKFSYICRKQTCMATRKQTAPRKKKSKKRDLKRSLLIYSALLLFGIASTLGLFIYSVYAGLWGKLPSYRDLQNIRHAEASVLYTEEGVMLGKYYIENRTNINFRNIPPDAVHALLATEDVRFYQHEGVDRISMLRVLFKTFLLGKRSSGGGSTLSQQLAKNLYPRDEQQVTFMPVVKLKEIFTARRLENIYNKEEILTLYLNTVSFGENAFGLESAAQKYFSATASELTLPQAATLIGMLKGPSYYNPRLHPDRALRRRNTVINQMVKYDFLTEAEGEKHKACELGLRYTPTTHYSGPAPYLRERIRQDALRIIEAYNAEYGTDYNLYTDGMLLTTTLDAEMQQYAEEAAKTHIARIQESYAAHLNGHEPWDKHPDILQNAIRNSRIYKSLKNKGRSEEEILAEMNRKKPMLIYHPDHREERVEYSSIDSIKHYLKIFQPALIAVEPQTGKVKAWVGGADYKYFQYDQVTAPRQVGSVFKPVVYAAALRHGARLDTYYSNEQRSYPEYNNWTPRNSDNHYDGYYTFKGALSKSINTIAVEVLMQTGIDTVAAYARRLGITADLPPYPSIALGVADIPLQEMVNPFMAFANNGILVPQYYLAEIRDRHGKIIYRTETGIRREAMPAEEAHIMSNILTAVVDEGTGRALRTRYGLHHEIAGKTGTTQHHVDGWFIGYTPRLVVGVRVGADNPDIHFNTIRLGQGAAMALPIYGDLIRRCLASPTYAHWHNLSFPMPVTTPDKHLEMPAFKEHLNLRDKITRPQLASPSRHPLREEKPQAPQRESFFKRLFKRKK